MDSQSIKGADTIGADTRGYDAGEKIHGRKRFIVTDTFGLLLVVLVLPASVQDRDGARKLLLELRHRQLLSQAVSRVRHLFADAGFAGALVDWARALLKTTIEIVRKPQGQKGFAVILRRWAVERTLAWLTAHRRLARDYERHPATAEAIIRWAAIATGTDGRGGRCRAAPSLPAGRGSQGHDRCRRRRSRGCSTQPSGRGRIAMSGIVFWSANGAKRRQHGADALEIDSVQDVV
ncbi:hypothetical protein GCM10027436_55450 [Actinophytocola sediminis]